MENCFSLERSERGRQPAPRHVRLLGARGKGKAVTLLGVGNGARPAFDGRRARLEGSGPATARCGRAAVFVAGRGGRFTSRRLRLRAVLAISLVAVVVLHAASMESAFEQANRLYAQGQFGAAAAAYQKLMTGGEVSPALYFNLGNAYFKSGRLGRAIAAFRAAQILAPRDPDVLANLKIVRENVSGPSAREHGWLEELQRLTVNEWSVLVAGALWLWFGLLTCGQWRPDWKRPLRAYTVLAGVATGVLAICGGATLINRYSVTPAVVIAPEAVARYGPLEQAQRAFSLPDGTEVIVLDRASGWLEVRDGDHRTGWVQQNQVQVLSQVRPRLGSPQSG